MNSTTPLRHPAAAQFHQALEMVQREVLTVLQHHTRTHGDHLVVLALCETFGALAAHLVERDPATRAHFLQRLDDLRLNIATAGQGGRPDEEVAEGGVKRLTMRRVHMSGIEHDAASDHPAAEWYRRDLERVESELLAVVRHWMPRVGYQLVAHALIETTGSVLGDIVEAEADARPDLDQRLQQLRLHVATVGQRAQ